MDDLMMQLLEACATLGPESRCLILKLARMMARSREFVKEYDTLIPPGEKCPSIADAQALVDEWARKPGVLV